ncbi:MAG: hypothetical protein PHV68_05995, partial [Candidatus Gastranaerophilales bacterium]|nr:hypothetical protein [Candidatus Gastranaerophilales bacterium]
MQSNKKFIYWFISILLIGIILKTRLIINALPFYLQVDERVLTESAEKIIKLGDFNPHFFNYPSLPIYFSTLFMFLGSLLLNPASIFSNTIQYDPVNYPFYNDLSVIFFTKFMFSLFSVGIIIFITKLAVKIYKKNLLYILVPIILSLSPLFCFHSAGYMNVDIVSSFFASAVVFYVINQFEKNSYQSKILIPGILCGM